MNVYITVNGYALCFLAFKKVGHRLPVYQTSGNLETHSGTFSLYAPTSSISITHFDDAWINNHMELYVLIVPILRRKLVLNC